MHNEAMPIFASTLEKLHMEAIRILVKCGASAMTDLGWEMFVYLGSKLMHLQSGSSSPSASQCPWPDCCHPDGEYPDSTLLQAHSDFRVFVDKCAAAILRGPSKPGQACDLRIGFSTNDRQTLYLITVWIHSIEETLINRFHARPYSVMMDPRPAVSQLWHNRLQEWLKLGRPNYQPVALQSLEEWTEDPSHSPVSAKTSVSAHTDSFVESLSSSHSTAEGQEEEKATNVNREYWKCSAAVG
ncbi:hypothetical protein BKA63DRAFT_495992 [Paraphoma chrysanthemicola]|nr:hypothetical protein BKA63DRAFT_495992 [Paraphoma chrysanthemicola]